MTGDSKGDPAWASGSSMLGWYSKQSSGPTSGPSLAAPEPEKKRKPAAAKPKLPEAKIEAKPAVPAAPAAPAPVAAEPARLDAQHNVGGIANARTSEPPLGQPAPADPAPEIASLRAQLAAARDVPHPIPTSG